jgi:hypothetical protein
MPSCDACERVHHRADRQIAEEIENGELTPGHAVVEALAVGRAPSQAGDMGACPSG